MVAFLLILGIIHINVILGDDGLCIVIRKIRQLVKIKVRTAN